MGETIWIRKNRWWWVACNPNEALGMCDSSSFVRARTRQRLIEKAAKRWGPKPFPWEVVELSETETETETKKEKEGK